MKLTATFSALLIATAGALLVGCREDVTPAPGDNAATPLDVYIAYTDALMAGDDDTITQYVLAEDSATARSMARFVATMDDSGKNSFATRTKTLRAEYSYEIDGDIAYLTKDGKRDFSLILRKHDDTWRIDLSEIPSTVPPTTEPTSP